MFRGLCLLPSSVLAHFSLFPISDSEVPCSPRSLQFGACACRWRAGISAPSVAARIWASARASAHQTLSASCVLACATALSEAEPQRKTLDAAAFWFLGTFKKHFPASVDQATAWDKYLVKKGCIRPDAATASTQRMANDAVAMAEISPDGKV